MAKYKVNQISILLKNNKTAKSGQIIDGSQLPNEKEAVKGKHVVLVKEEKKEVKKAAKK